MKYLFLLLATLPLMAQMGPDNVTYRVSTMAALRNFVPRIDKHVVVVATYATSGDRGGGIFYWDAGNTKPTNRWGVIGTTTGAVGRWIREWQPPFMVTWCGGTNLTTPAIQEAIVAGAGGEVSFPAHATYHVTSPLYVNCDTTLNGNGAVIINGVTNANPMILMDIVGKKNIRVRGLTLTHPLGSHWNTGNLWIRDCTNVVAEDCIFNYGGYLANFVVLKSKLCGAIRCRAYDQLYGTSGQSTAHVSFAEDSYDCFWVDSIVDFPTLGKLNLGWKPFGQGDPYYPKLAISIDRAPRFHIENFTIQNTSGATNLIGLEVEDNTKLSNFWFRASSGTINGMEVGSHHYMGRIRSTYSQVDFINNTKQAFDLAQSEEADTNNVESIIFSQCRFLNNNPNPTIGTFLTVPGGHTQWYNNGGQIRYVSRPTYRMRIVDCDFISDSPSTNFMHILYGGGDLTVSGCTFLQNDNLEAYGIRATDPIALTPNVLTSLWLDQATMRKNFTVHDNRFLGFQQAKTIYGLTDPFGDSLVDQQGRRTIEGVVEKTIPLNTPTRIFSVQTVNSAANSVGKSGSYTCFIQMHVSNAPTNHNSFNLGQVGAQGMLLQWTHVIQHDEPSQIENSAVASVSVTPIAKTGARGYQDYQFALANPSPMTTDLMMTTAGQGDVTQAEVYARVWILHSGFYQSPQLLK